MVSSGVTMARMCSSTIPPSSETVTVHCRKETWSNSKLCKGRKVRKLPTCKNQADHRFTYFCSRRDAILAGFSFSRCRVSEEVEDRAPLPRLVGLVIFALMDNKTIARILRDTAQLLEIDGAIIGRYRSYEKAAELISGMHESIEELARDPDKLEELPGIGERMA